MLKIKVDVPLEYALTALSWYIGEEDAITDVIAFRHAIRKYLFEYGCSRLDTHADVYSQYMGEARELCNKYYNK